MHSTNPTSVIPPSTFFPCEGCFPPSMLVQYSGGREKDPLPSAIPAVFHHSGSLPSTSRMARLRSSMPCLKRLTAVVTEQ